MDGVTPTPGGQPGDVKENRLMSEENGQQAEQTEQGQQQEQTKEPEFQPITSQEDFNRLVGERIKKVRSQYADYDDLRAKATKYDEVEQANKSEIEKANDRASKAEESATKAVAEAMRLRVAAKHGISDEDADLFLTGSDEETLTKQAERLAAREADRKRTGNTSPTEGQTPTNTSTGDWLRDSLSRK